MKFTVFWTYTLPMSTIPGFTRVLASDIGQAWTMCEKEIGTPFAIVEGHPNVPSHDDMEQEGFKLLVRDFRE